MFGSKRSLNINKDLLTLPFDQYSRQYYVSKIIHLLAQDILHKQQMKILDIGGYKGKTAAFQAQDEVIVADLFDVTEEGYVKVDGKSLPFKEASFDVSVSFDTYEHVPRDNRPAFIEESLRVSSTMLILAAPFDDEHGTVYAAETLANETYKNLSGNDHRWLKEHLDYRTPTTDQFEQYCNKSNIHFLKISTNELITWLMLQQFFFCAELNSQTFSQVEKINTFYNENIADIETGLARESTYRSIYCLSKDLDLISTLSDKISSMQSLDTSRDSPAKQTSLLKLTQLVADGYMLLKD